MDFKDLNLNSQLLNALEEMGFTHPTTIQQKAFPVIMSGRDVCGIAQTGTGKTLAYLLPLLRLYKYSKDRNTQILILVPTRELVAQVAETVTELAKYTSVEVAGVFGDYEAVGAVTEFFDRIETIILLLIRMYQS